jgi:hypothetical protein
LHTVSNGDISRRFKFLDISNAQRSQLNADWTLVKSVARRRTTQVSHAMSSTAPQPQSGTRKALRSTTFSNYPNSRLPEI